MATSSTNHTTPGMDEAPPRERLRLVHYFLWITLIAVIVFVTRPGESSSNRRLETGLSIRGEFLYGCYLQAELVWQAALFSLGIAALIVAGMRFFCQGPRRPAHAGHWLLFVSGWHGLASLAQLVIPVTEVNVPAHMFVEMAKMILSIETFFLAAYCTQQPWRFVFWLGGARDLSLVCIGYLLPFRGPWVIGLVVGLAYGFWMVMLCLAIYEGWRGPRRDSVHWIGVITTIANCVLPLFGSTLAAWIQKA